MSTLIIAWPLKRSAVARLQSYANGDIPAPSDIEALVGAQVETVMPAEPDRACVYGTAIQSSRRLATEERGISIESVRLELRVRVFQPGTADEDVGDVDRQVGDLCQAVARALIDYEPIMQPGTGTLWLQQIVQWPTAIVPYPEPSVTCMASMFFQAEVITT